MEGRWKLRSAGVGDGEDLVCVVMNGWAFTGLGRWAGAWVSLLAGRGVVRGLSLMDEKIFEVGKDVRLKKRFSAVMISLHCRIDTWTRLFRC